MRGEKLETLIADMKRSHGLRARLGTRLANIRTARERTPMFIWRRGGEARLHVCRLAEATGKPKGRRLSTKRRAPAANLDSRPSR